MDTIHIDIPSKRYPVWIGHNLIVELPELLRKIKKPSKLMIVTDENVSKLHLSTIMDILSSYECFTFITPSGEAAKTFEVYYEGLTFALEHKLDRNSMLIAFGGGSIGDLGGFIAATFMRGIPFIQVPTTILAHDSAVGGKVAINHPVGKNMIGSFYQPEAVLYDLKFINTLPLKERRSGFAELIKHALIDDLTFYNRLVNTIQSLKSLNSEQLQPFLLEGIKVKSKIVAADEKEIGQRAFLNFGHTLGHAIEAEVGYGQITHGEAVVIGMVFALQLSRELLNLSFPLDPFIRWLQLLEYETSIPDGINRMSLVKRMKQDKKSSNENINMVLLSEIGTPLLMTVSDEDLIKHLNKM
jgi:3-dehydroquinate synthase